MKKTLAIILAIISIGYLLPTSISLGKSRTNTGAIFAFNLFLGWTLIGWVVALTWALTEDN